MSGINFRCSNCGCGSIDHAVEWAPPGTPLDKSFAIGSHASIRLAVAAHGRRGWRVCRNEACPRQTCKGAYEMLDPRTVKQAPALKSAG